MPDQPKQSLGPPLEWSESDLDALSQVGPTDARAAEALWRRGAPPWAKALLSAEPEETDG